MSPRAVAGSAEEKRKKEVSGREALARRVETRNERPETMNEPGKRGVESAGKSEENKRIRLQTVTADKRPGVVSKSLDQEEDDSSGRCVSREHSSASSR